MSANLQKLFELQTVMLQLSTMPQRRKEALERYQRDMEVLEKCEADLLELLKEYQK